MVANAFNPSTLEAEAGWFQGQPVLQNDFEESKGYKEKHCLEKQQQQQWALRNPA